MSPPPAAERLEQKENREPEAEVEERAPLVKSLDLGYNLVKMTN